MADVGKFCLDIKGGRGEIMKCLNDHQAELSQACKDRLAEIKEKRIEKARDALNKVDEDVIEKDYNPQFLPGTKIPVLESDYPE